MRIVQKFQLEKQQKCKQKGYVNFIWSFAA